VHSRKLGLIREQCRQNHGLLKLEQCTISTVFGDFEYDRDVGTIQRQALLDGLSDGVFLGSLVVLEAPDFRVVLGEVLIGIPVAVFERFDTSVFLEAHSRVFQRRVDLIREVHIFFGALFHVGMFLMTLG
jgi:hypothetical protein